MRAAESARSVLFVVLLATALFACSTDNPAVVADLDETFSIGVGQSAHVHDAEIDVEFVEVIGDSRCPQNATCVWEGVAASHVMVSYEHEDFDLVLNQPGLSEHTETSFAGYKITHSLNPYPREGETIDPKDYVLTLTVTR